MLACALCIVFASHPIDAQYADSYCPTCPNGMCGQDSWQPAASSPRTISVAPSGTTPNPAICRIVNTVGRAGNFGSGTLVASSGNVGFVLTCGHLFSEGQGNIVVEFSGGRRYEARLVEIDKANDLAALAIATPGIAPLEIDAATPAGQLSACGYGSNGQFSCARGSVVGYATPVGATAPSMKISGAVRAGDSGGAVTNAQGRLVGVIWGVRDGITYATFGQPLRTFLARLQEGRRVAGSSEEGRRVAGSRVEEQDVSPFAELDARLSTVEDRLASWPDASDFVTRNELDELARRDELQGFATQTDVANVQRQAADGHATILAKVQADIRNTTVEAKSAAVSVVKQRIAERVGLFEGMSAGKMLVGVLGVSGPLGLAMVAASAVAGRRLKRRLEKRVTKSSGPRPSDSPPSTSRPSTTSPIAVDTPPPPQKTVPETHYVPYERDEFSRAYQWASEQVARKYPGAVDTLTTLDSLIKQQVNAN
jgi:hypothetical protein